MVVRILKLENFMHKQLLNLALLILLATGCKLSAFNQNSAQNTGSPAPPVNAAENKAALDARANSNFNSPNQTTFQPSNLVCADPAKPCHHKEKNFDDWELSFKMPAKLAPNKTYTSAPFYAVILKTYEMREDCDGGEYIESVEAERRKLQANQSARKVFAAYQCPNMAAVNYEFDGKWSADKESIVIGNFLAIYGGGAEAEAEKLLNGLKSEYPEAEIKKMTVSYENIEQ